MQFKPPFPNAPNQVLDCGEFFISYSENVGKGFDPFLVALGRMNQDNLGRPETALIIPDDTKITGHRYLILYGDYRKAYAAVAHLGLDACIELFNKHIHHIADASDKSPRTRH